MLKKLNLFVAVCLFLVVVSGCGESPATSTVPVPTKRPPTAIPKPTATPPPTATAKPAVVYDFGASSSQDDQKEIRRGIELAEQEFGVINNLKIRIDSNEEFADENDDLLGSAVPGELVLYARTYQWVKANAGEHIATVIHEYYHAVQYSLAGRTASNRNAERLMPWWLLEGSAEFISYEAAAKAKELNFVEAVDERELYVTYSAYPLKTIESRQAYTPMSPYVIGFLATQYLVNVIASKAALKNYWQTLATESNWKIAFQKSFGMSVDTFYARFEKYRLQEYPSNIPIGSLSMPKYSGTYSLDFVGTLPPVTLNQSNSKFIPYVFQISGVRLEDLDFNQLDKGLRLPAPITSRSYPGGNTLAVYVQPDLAPGKYTVRLKLPDGRQNEVTFQYPSSTELKAKP